MKRILAEKLKCFAGTFLFSHGGKNHKDWNPQNVVPDGTWKLNCTENDHALSAAEKQQIITSTTFYQGLYSAEFYRRRLHPEIQPLTMDHIMAERQPLPEETHLFSSRQRYTEITAFPTRSNNLRRKFVPFSILETWKRYSFPAKFRRIYTIGCIPR